MKLVEFRTQTEHKEVQGSSYKVLKSLSAAEQHDEDIKLQMWTLCCFLLVRLSSLTASGLRLVSRCGSSDRLRPSAPECQQKPSAAARVLRSGAVLQPVCLCVSSPLPVSLYPALFVSPSCGLVWVKVHLGGMEAEL